MSLRLSDWSPFRHPHSSAHPPTPFQRAARREAPREHRMPGRRVSPFPANFLRYTAPRIHRVHARERHVETLLYVEHPSTGAPWSLAGFEMNSKYASRRDQDGGFVVDRDYDRGEGRTIGCNAAPIPKRRSCIVWFLENDRRGVCHQSLGTDRANGDVGRRGSRYRRTVNGQQGKEGDSRATQASLCPARLRRSVRVSTHGRTVLEAAWWGDRWRGRRGRHARWGSFYTPISVGVGLDAVPVLRCQQRMWHLVVGIRHRADDAEIALATPLSEIYSETTFVNFIRTITHRCIIGQRRCCVVLEGSVEL
ncbi:hypothetical protein KM043_016184 [Ampulex compressa]|nr:hypothetical protein KM043_016184 [Ampulex compressa]